MLLVRLKPAIFLCIFLPLLCAHADTRPQVVASFSILGDLVAQVGGARISLQVLVGPDQDAHMYQPTPEDTSRLAAADLVVVNGLGFEGWLERLIEASGYAGSITVGSEGLENTQLAAGTQADPHAWQSVPAVKLYLANILQGLVELDPAGRDYYHRNARAYLAQLDALHAQILQEVNALPPAQRTVVTSHDAFAYFSREYGLRFVAPQGLNTDAEPSARDVATLIRQIREQNIPAIFVENISDRRLLQQIAQETEAVIGGTLYSDALSQPDGKAGSYLNLMRHNLRTLTEALQTEPLGTL